jgi:hypothetical protein
MLANPHTMMTAMCALFCIGPSSIPALERACHSHDMGVSSYAALLLAKMDEGGQRGWWRQWRAAPVNGKPLVDVTFIIMEEDAMAMSMKLESPDPAIRLANIAGLSSFTRPFSDTLPAVRKALDKALDDPDEAVKHAAKEVIKDF